MSGHPFPFSTEPLHIVCPHARQPVAIVLSGAGLAVLAMAATSLLNGPPERFSWFKLWLLVLVGSACVALVYRNLFVRDELLLYRDEPGEWAREDEDRLVLAAGRVRAVRVCPPPSPYSAEGKNAGLGIQTGLIEIETLDGAYRFGAGLDEDLSRVTARRIAAYCGLQEAGPGWKTAPGQA